MKYVAIALFFGVLAAVLWPVVSGRGGGKSSGGEKPSAKTSEPVVVWAHGGFAPSANCVVDRALAVKSVDSKGVDFVFAGDDYWGSTHDDPSMRCCAFYWDGGKYVGGFWEWGSPDRTSRAFDNITGRYKGWEPAKFNAAKKLAFCVCSKDGKHRTPIVEIER